jgi:CheY-like chemotaxis protein
VEAQRVTSQRAVRAADEDGDAEREQSGVIPRVASASDDTRVLADRYVVGAELGRGAIGVVYAALDTLLGREVAVKTFPHLDPHVQVDVAGEARALAAIHHPNVVAVYALRADAQPPFLVMERARGTRLDAILHERSLSVSRTLSILRQIAKGLDAIHAVGLVHGDVKPANVLVDDEDRVKLIDVGLAPLLQRISPGDVFGTTAYIAPERALATVPEPRWASRGDVYSFAVLCFEMLTGDRPFGGDEQVLLYAHAFEEAPLATQMSPSLSRAFDAPLARALSKSAEQRQPSCGALVQELDHASRGTGERGEPLEIVVADDDDDCLALTRAGLAAALPGAHVRTCASGAAVLETVAAIAPAVVVLDLVMPGLSGVELVAAVRAASPTSHVVVATGVGSGAERLATSQLGVRSFLVKPYRTDELVRAICTAASERTVTDGLPR